MSKELETKKTSEDGVIEKSNESKSALVKEVNGREGLEPTRYGDWEKNGRCIDF